MDVPTRYLVRVRKVRANEPAYGWELCQGDDSVVIQRSTKVFATRAEALADSAQMAAPLALCTGVQTASGLPKGHGVGLDAQLSNSVHYE
jgi:hypothetical protein